MKKVITPVGTSIFENYKKNNNESFKKVYEYFFKNKLRSNKYDDEKGRIEIIYEKINKWLENNKDPNISAEVKSLKKISEELNEDLEVYLLASDTVLSRIAGEILEEQIPNIVPNCEVKKLYVIENLQIWNRRDFNKGMSNLISKIYEISGEYWDNVIINITGGYKATIPYLTILAQLNNCLIYYIFEDTDSLIKIPNIPFSKDWFDWEEIDKYNEGFLKLEKGIDDKGDYEKLIQSEFYQKYSFLIWTSEDTLAELNPIGKIIFEKYKDLYFEFFTTKEVAEKIDTDENLNRLFKEKFWKKEIRESKTEIKNGHYVYDDGNNQLRIFYREKEGILYVYEVFNDHAKYELYLEQQPFKEDLFEKGFLNEKFFKKRIRKEV